MITMADMTTVTAAFTTMTTMATLMVIRRLAAAKDGHDDDFEHGDANSGDDQHAHDQYDDRNDDRNDYKCADLQS